MMHSDSQKLRKQIEETRQRLTNDVTSLQLQAKSEAADVVVDIAQKAMRSLRSTLNLRNQIARHPWTVMGGAALFAYLLVGRSNRFRRSAETAQSDHLSMKSAPAIGEPLSNDGVRSQRERQIPTTLHRVGNILLDTLAVIVPPLVARLAPPLIDRAVHKLTQSRSNAAAVDVLEKPLPNASTTVYLIPSPQQPEAPTSETGPTRLPHLHDPQSLRCHSD